MLSTNLHYSEELTRFAQIIKRINLVFSVLIPIQIVLLLVLANMIEKWLTVGANVKVVDINLTNAMYGVVLGIGWYYLTRRLFVKVVYSYLHKVIQRGWTMTIFSPYGFGISLLTGVSVVLSIYLGIASGFPIKLLLSATFLTTQYSLSLSYLAKTLKNNVN